MFVRFDCGCVGVQIQGKGDYIIRPCDTYDEEYCLYSRDMSDKGHTPLSGEDTLQLWEDLASFVKDGYKFRSIKGLLR